MKMDQGSTAAFQLQVNHSYNESRAIPVKNEEAIRRESFIKRLC
jgi:hypothetical protein